VTKFQPDGWSTVTPRIITDDVDGLVAFLRSVFAARGARRADGPAEMKIGDSIIVVSDGGGVRERMPAFLYVYVENADKTYLHAIASGAQPIERPMDTPYGDRRATIQDAWGNLWQIATRRVRRPRNPTARERQSGCQSSGAGPS
jgi:PhnB protein